MSTQPDMSEPLWYRVKLEKKTMKKLQGRTNWQGLVWFGTYAGALGLFATFAVLDVLPVWARGVSFLAYSTVYCFSEAILHETHHRTAFRSSWLNETVHYIAGLLAFKEPIRDRWLHAGHHTYTNYPNIDPEIVLEPPPHFRFLAMDVLRLRFVPSWLLGTVRNMFGPDVLAKRFVPVSEHATIRRSATACVAVYIAVIAAAVIFQTWWPILFVFAARFVGSWLHAWITLPQHVGLATEVPDWRQNTRTILTNPINRFLAWNMTYHVEHHMNPTVPFHALPALYGKIEHDCPPAYTSTWAAWREMLPALWRQKKDPSYFIMRPLPISSEEAVKAATEAGKELAAEKNEH